MGSSDGVRCTKERLSLPRDSSARLIRLRDGASGLECGVVPEAGAEIATLRVRCGGRWREILYRALEYADVAPDGWDGRAPLLWPVCGRTNTPEQLARARATGKAPRGFRYRWKGRLYPMKMHGFVRHMAWELLDCGVGRGGAFVVCGLSSTSATRRYYPFDWSLEVRHALRGNRITSRYEVVAGGNDCPMPFTIGNHIGFVLPMTTRARFDDCTLRTPSTRQYVFDRFALPAGRWRSRSCARPVPMSSGIWADTFLGGYSRRTAWAELAEPGGLTVRLSQSERPQRGRYRSREKDLHFCLWGSPELGYFCPEPWIGEPNALNSGKGLIELPPGERFVWEMRMVFGLGTGRAR